MIKDSSIQLPSIKKCLILSDGPVPTPEHTKVEGGGLRSWGIAKGVKGNNPSIDVTVAYNESHRKPDTFTDYYEDINIQTWNLAAIPELIENYDTVIVSYCMGQLSVEVANTIGVNQQLILDCYVPIYVEVSARQSDNLDAEYGAFHHDVPRWAHVLRRGDLFLCASEPQKKFYEGVLASLGRINPATYGEDLIEIVPYGIYRDEPRQKAHPIQKLIGKDHKKYRKLLWFGGIYPWFDISDLIRAASIVNEKIPTKLIIVGAKNPFNSHPDFLRKYDEMLEYIKAHDLEDLVIIQDWVSFDSRADWYLDSDLVVVINRLGQENNLAWRTRLVDFTWANLPIITNGGDPVSLMLKEAGAISLFNGLEPEQMAKDISRILENNKELESIKGNLSKVRKRLYWDTITKSVSEAIVTHRKPADFSRYGFYDAIADPEGGVRSKIKKITRKIRKVPAYTRKYGLKSTYYTIGSVIKSRVGKRFSKGRPRVVIVSHQLDMSGAPFVIMDFAKSFHKKYPELPLEFFTFNPVHHNNIVELNKYGIRPKILVDREAVIDFHDGDVVVFNTIAQSAALRGEVFSRLEKGSLKKLYWYVHEDEPELIFSRSEAGHIKALMEHNKIEMVTAAVKTRDNYRNYIGNIANINIQPYQIITPKKYHRTLKAEDFEDKLSFILPGTIGDGRKGQLPIFYAFEDFYHNIYKKNPSHYRDFELVYIGVSDDFLSRQLLRHADKALDGRFKPVGRVTKEECLDLVLKSNVTICYSIRESLPLFVFEGMIAGHPILRNDSSGMEEQLVDGKNGFYLDSTDLEQVKVVIEKILNKKTTTDKELEAMSKKSYKISVAQEKHSYDPLSDKVKGSFDAKE